MLRLIYSLNGTKSRLEKQAAEVINQRGAHEKERMVPRAGIEPERYLGQGVLVSCVTNITTSHHSLRRLSPYTVRLICSAVLSAYHVVL